MPIPIVQARQLFTQYLMEVYRERIAPTSFLRSFFEVRQSSTRYVSIEVKRGTEKVASDVLRGTVGNRNNWPRSTQKTWEPPFYDEYFDATEIDLYDRVFGQDSDGSMMSEGTFADFLENVAEKVGEMQDLIDRRYELQAAQVFQTGIVLVDKSNNIDFKRKSGSIVDLGTGNYWDAANSKPLSNLEAAGDFLRTQGKVTDGIINLIMGSKALNEFFRNAEIKDTANFRRVNLIDISNPRDAGLGVGSKLHGEVSAGSYTFRIWTYPQFYEDAQENLIPYIDVNNVIAIPQAPRFRHAFAAVPKIFRDVPNAEFDGFITNEQAQYVVSNYIDQKNTAHIFEIKSAALMVPVTVDQIFTMKVLADA